MEVLFKPTKASEVPIATATRPGRVLFVGAAAGDDIGIKEDKGFAINPWTVGARRIKNTVRHQRASQAVRFENADPQRRFATAMGEYYFTTLEGTVAKVERCKRGADGNLKIVVHHSSLPYSP